MLAGPLFSVCVTMEPMFALAAVITFAIAFILALMSTSTGHISLLFLGLLFVSLHLLTGVGVPWNRRV